MRRNALVFTAILALASVSAMGQTSIKRGFQWIADSTPTAIGSGGALATVGGVLTTSTTAACTIADTNETDLWVYSLPANTLTANGRGLRISVAGTTGADANTKTVRLYIGATSFTVLSSAASGVLWTADSTALRTGASAEYAVLKSLAGSALSTGQVSPAADTTAAITIKVTGQNGTAAANDVCFKSAIVETLK